MLTNRGSIFLASIIDLTRKNRHKFCIQSRYKWPPNSPTLRYEKTALCKDGFSNLYAICVRDELRARPLLNKEACYALENEVVHANRFKWCFMVDLSNHPRSHQVTSIFLRQNALLTAERFAGLTYAHYNGFIRALEYNYFIYNYIFIMNYIVTLLYHL
jgi:hypothetical protein